MNIQLDGMNIHYEITGKGNDVLLLHGWGANTQVMQTIADGLSDRLRVCNLDLPGFGESDEPREDDWDVYSYAEFVKKFCEAADIRNPIIIAHSYGGRLAIILSGKKMMKINKMVLAGSAGIRGKRGLLYYTKVYSYKLSKKIIKLIGALSQGTEERMKQKFGSEDYRNANDKMRKVMVRSINEDLTYLLPSVEEPTLLIWGENDDATPVTDGKTMEKLMKDAGLVILPNAGHYVFLDQRGRFIQIVRKFLEKEIGGR